MQRVIHSIILVAIALSLTACATVRPTPPPQNTHSACSMFNQYPSWRSSALQVQDRWHIPVSVQMAIVNQESSFVADAKTPRTKLFGIIPWKHISSAYGYSQALNGTWNDYVQNTHQVQARRDVFGDGLDFIGWYADQAHNKLNIPLNDPYRLYLAYHEGLGGYSHQSFLSKPWLINVAQKVKYLAGLYQKQLNNCDSAVV